METQNRRMERLIDISRELSSALDLNRVLQSILSAAAELTGSETASVLGLDVVGHDLRLLTLPESRQPTVETVFVPLDQSIAGMAFLEQKTIVVDHVSLSAPHFKNTDEFNRYRLHSLLAAPILFHNNSLGALEVINKLDGADYNGDDITILETLASQAAIAVQNSRLQALLEKNLDDTERLAKMKIDFVAITSHELRTPLGLILGHSTFLREIVGPQYRGQLDTIIKNAMKLKEIIENISKVDNFETGMSTVRRRTVAVSRLILDTITKHQAETQKKGITLNVDLPDSDLMVDGDAEKIGIVLSNLIANAIEFSDEGGHVLVTAEQIPGYVKVAIIDHGIGIAATDLPHIFERFYQIESHLTRKHGGMGLGLSVAKMMVEMHGGRIWAESIEGQGSMFTILLPLDAPPPQPPERVFR